MLDRDLAEVYGVPTKRLNQQVRRNRSRFPADFIFQLNLKEAKEISGSRLQIETLKKGQNVKHAPHVFTEQSLFENPVGPNWIACETLQEQRACSFRRGRPRAPQQCRCPKSFSEGLSILISDLPCTQRPIYSGSHNTAKCKLEESAGSMTAHSSSLSPYYANLSNYCLSSRLFPGIDVLDAVPLVLECSAVPTEE